MELFAKKDIQNNRTRILLAPLYLTCLAITASASSYCFKRSRFPVPINRHTEEALEKKRAMKKLRKTVVHSSDLESEDDAVPQPDKATAKQVGSSLLF